MFVMTGVEHVRAGMMEGSCLSLDGSGSEALVSVEELASRLPDLPTVKAWLQSLAVMDAILTPDRRFRCFSYSALPEDEQVGAWQDGSGDDYSFVFTPHGAFARGFCHESPLRDFSFTPPRLWPGLLDGVPAALRDVAAPMTYDATQGGALATLTLWRLVGESRWSYGRVSYPADLADGWEDVQTPEMFDNLDGRPDTYANDIEEVEQVVLDINAVAHVFAHLPLTEDVVAALNPERAFADLAFDLIAIGYPGEPPGALQ
jgi:hypothetical protein